MDIQREVEEGGKDEGDELIAESEVPRLVVEGQVRERTNDYYYGCSKKCGENC